MTNPPLTFGAIQKTLVAFLKRNQYSKIFILVDENTKELCLPLLPEFEYSIIEISSGEANKNLETCQLIWTILLQCSADRNSLLINLGGGVICDMGGFAASCYKRGISFIHIPTTLLAMVDASIGGKTGIDFMQQKNMIGLFSEAQAVLIDSSFLKTLGPRQINSGKAEMIKHGLIADKNHLDQVFASKAINDLLIQSSISIKQYIVQQDPLEKGVRKSLNFGHTLGHAIETLALQNGEDLLHGEAVAQGMVLALKLSMNYARFSEDEGLEIIQKIEAIYGHFNLDKKLLDQLIFIAKNDKKNLDDKINFSLLSRIEKCEINQGLSAEELSVLIA